MLGSWMRPVMRLLAWGKRLRGTPLDVFGYSHERRTERALIDAYTALIAQVLPQITAANADVARELFALPLSIRGFGHVKARNLQAAQTRQAWLLHRLNPSRYPRPLDAPGTRQFKGIAVNSLSRQR